MAGPQQKWIEPIPKKKFAGPNGSDELQFEHFVICGPAQSSDGALLTSVLDHSS